MADRVEALVLQMSVDLRKLQKDMDKAKRTTAGGLSDIEGKFSKTSKKVKEDAEKMGGAFEDMARGIPVIGDALVAIGPAGAAAGAGLAAIALGAKGIFDQAEAARKKIDDLATSAENVATSAESFQAFKALGIELDVPFDKIEAGLNKLQIGAAEAATGTGALFNGLKKIKPELIDTIVQAQTQEDRWDALSAAITSTDNQLEKVAIAKAAFGKAGAQFVRLLDGEDKTVRNLTNRYRDLGIILSEDLVRQVGEADQRMQLSAARMDANATRAAAAWIPAVEALSTAWADLNVGLGIFFDRMSPENQQQVQTMQSRLADLNKEISNIQVVELRNSNRSFQENNGPRLAAQEQALQRRKELLELQIELKKMPIYKGPTSTSEVSDPDAEAAAEAKRVAELGRLQQERSRQRQAAAQVLNELGDSTELVKIKEQDLNSVVASGFLTREQANASLELYRQSLVKTTEAQKLAAAQEKIWLAVLDTAKGPIEKAEEAISEFWSAVQFGTIGPGDRAAEILAILTKNLQDARTAARAATPEFQAIARAREAIAAATEAGLSSADRRANERSRLNSLVGQDGFSQGEADKAFQLFTDQEQADFREATRDSVKAGIREGLVTDDWGEQLRAMLADGVVNGLDDALNRLSDFLADLVLGKKDGDGGLLGTAARFVFGGARANGGGVNQNRDYLVGEKGPEILRMGPGQSGQVLNANQVNSLSAGGGGGGGIYMDNRIAIGGVDMATWPQVQAALAAQARAIAARMPGAVNATLASNRRQKRRY